MGEITHYFRLKNLVNSRIAPYNGIAELWYNDIKFWSKRKTMNCVAYDPLIDKRANNNLMKKIYAASLILLLTFCATDKSWADVAQKHKATTKSKTQVNPKINLAPVDTAYYLIEVNGQTNSVKINNEPVQTTTGKSGKQSTIRVNGEGNSVSVNQDNKNSKVNISQNGNNNQISITQQKQ